ncbi:MAG: hypothetical protein KA073_00580 [Aliarcobacter sp.]|nr:hypothetical protein [Aliarcobacter sp.]
MIKILNLIGRTKKLFIEDIEIYDDNLKNSKFLEQRVVNIPSSVKI